MVLKVIIFLMSLLNAGYMAFDGGRALFTGDYIRPQTGKYAGQLGPWSRVVESIGIDPMSGLMKTIFLIIGIYGLISVFTFMFNPKAGWIMLLIFCILSSWNLMFGTMSSLIVIVLLVIYKLK